MTPDAAAARYDTIGQQYIQTRRADPRIMVALLATLALPVGATIGDIGARTGNYSAALAEAGYRVVAVEPSAVTLAQRQEAPTLHWVAPIRLTLCHLHSSWRHRAM
jgi:protein-L-isoaspartate O-methyltransferase